MSNHIKFPPPNIETDFNFYGKINRLTDDECWNWIGGKDEHGYGKFGVRINKKTIIVKATRYMYFLHYKIDPGEFEVMHTCNSPPCVNPNHLILGTHSDNMKYAYVCGRSMIPKQNGELHSCAITTKEGCREIIRLRSLGLTHKEISKIFNCDRSTIGNILSGKSNYGVIN